MKHNILKSLFISVILLAGTSNVWAWNPVYLIGDPTGNWNSDQTKYVISNNQDEGSAYVHFSQNSSFAVYIGWYNEQAGPDKNGAEMNINSGSQKFYIWDNGQNTNAAKYVGNSGIVEIHAKQKDNGDDRPWIWLTRPTIKIKHGWNGATTWTEKDMTDKQNGTYTYIGEYSGSAEANFGIGSTGTTLKYLSSITTKGNPSKGNRCLFTYQSSGYKGFGSETENTGSATITKLCALTYNGNGKTGGNVPDKVEDIEYNNSITLSSSVLTKNGYTHTGWNTKADGTGTNYALGASFTLTEINHTLYAKWTPEQYNITYKDKGNATFSGTHETGYPTTHTYSTATTLKSATKTGYTFGGWYTSSDCTGSAITTLGATAYTAAITLYAKWTANTYTVTLDREPSTDGTASVTATYDAAMPAITIPTRTGYTFGGYYTEKNGGGTQYYNANGGSAKKWNIASKTTLYAKWTETKHNVQIKANNNAYGTVSLSSVNVGQFTASVTITATPKFGHVFKYWSATDGVTISDEYSASTTIKATQAGTLTAVFAKGEPVSIYMRANHIWKRADARYAVYYWHGSDNGWADMEEVGSCDETYYKAQIPFGYTDYLIARLDPKKKENNFTLAENGGPFWNETADIVMPQDGKTFYNMRKIYFRPNNLWITNNNARFAAYFLVKDDLTKNKCKWMSLLPTETDGLYWCDFPTEHNFDQVIFCSMEPANQTNDWSNRWNETATQELINVNCFTMKEGEWGKGTGIDADKPGATGSWSMIGEKPGYDLTLYASSFGEYGYIHNNTRYYSPKSGSEIHKIPFENPTIKIFSNPYSDQYRGDVMYNVIGANDRSELQPGETLTFHCNTVLDDNYKTKGTHVVYLAVPNNNGSWINNAATKHHVYAFHSRTEEGKGESVFMGPEVGRAKIKLGKDEVEHIYFRCEVPAWCNTIRFEKRVNEQAGNNDLRTIDLKYEIPLNSINCYRLDRKEDPNNNHSYAGLWEEAPGFNGDYRVICQRKEGDKVVEYASDVIRKGTTSQTISLHIYTVGADENYPKLILQKHDGTEWKAVNGQDKLVTDISKIMSDTKEDGCGVWNFVVTQNADGSNPKVNFDAPERYTGNYYIRTNNAEGQWRNYTLNTNQMTFSSYAKHNSGYSHYFCKWVDINMINEKESSKLPGHNNNVKFIIANDHGAAISAEMAEDAHTASGGILPQDANVRWTWNEKDNSVSRAYILGAYDPDKGGARNENIVVNYTTGAQKDTLEDKENWIYEIDLKDVKVDSKLTTLQATYPSEDKTVYIDETTKKTVKPITQTFASNLNMLDAEDGNNNTYTVRIIYDFKIDKTLVMLLPDKDYESHIGIDVFIDRTDQGEATQVKATITRNTPGYTVYGTMTFTQEHIMSLVKTEWERLYYWVSFPFDVRISDVFGFGEYGKHWIMEYYDGAARAENGCWADSPTYWRQIKDTTVSERRDDEDINGNPQNGILKANKGYVLALARNIAKSDIFKHGNTYVRLYFPSREKIHSIDANMQDVTAYLQPHTCTIEREDRNIYDSNWHIIGVPSYADKEQTLTQENLLYYYTYNTTNNTYSPTSAKDKNVEFKSMHAYMVQFAGNINWQSWTLTPEPQSVVARQQSAETQEDYALRLELQRDGQYADQAFVQLKAEGATADFDMNQDLTKIINAGANIYTLAGEKRIQVAGNVLPIAKTTIPVGIQVAQAGTYTIALPDGTSGISATLVDNQTGTHTNLLLEDYTITLDAGSHENRFYIVLDPERSATAVENIGDVQGDKAQKFLIDGQLIIRTEQGVYDATGGKVK